METPKQTHLKKSRSFYMASRALQLSRARSPISLRVKRNWVLGRHPNRYLLKTEPQYIGLCRTDKFYDFVAMTHLYAFDSQLLIF